MHFLKVLQRLRGSEGVYDPFYLPPFSLLDSRRGLWLARKRWWLRKGIQGEIGRAKGVMRGMSSVGSRTVYGAVQRRKGQEAPHETMYEMQDDHVIRRELDYSTSVFDPVLCEVVYQWFTAPGWRILDPFAGGSVRGVVASVMGREYVGVDLSSEQVEANRIQGKEIPEAHRARWVVGDAIDLDSETHGDGYDLIFSCPPYADLEVYSNDPRDLSTLEYSDFLTKYRAIVDKACALLAPNRFACFVVGEVRHKKTGLFYGFVPDTVRAFQDAGLDFYNEMVLAVPDGSLPMRANRSLRSSRKISKMHQQVLIFVKGDPKLATADLDARQSEAPWLET